MWKIEVEWSIYFFKNIFFQYKRKKKLVVLKFGKFQVKEKMFFPPQ